MTLNAHRMQLDDLDQFRISWVELTTKDLDLLNIVSLPKEARLDLWRILGDMMEVWSVANDAADRIEDAWDRAEVAAGRVVYDRRNCSHADVLGVVVHALHQAITLLRLGLEEDCNTLAEASRIEPDLLATIGRLKVAIPKWLDTYGTPAPATT